MKKFFIISFSFLILSLGFWTSSAHAAFPDVPSSHPYNVSVNYVQSEGIVSGYADGTYQPDRTLNRAEFTKILIESRFDENTINSCVNRGGFYETAIFKDVGPGEWFEKYVCVAKQKNVIQGYDDGTFRPIQPINFAEAAKIVTISYGLKFTQTDIWYEGYLNKLASLDATPPTIQAIEAGGPRAAQPINRGEMADVVYRLRNLQDKIQSDDGNFAIQVPEVALPSGIQASDIKISRLTESENPVQEVNGAPMLFYKLEPDGITFEEPVTFTIETQTVANTVPMVFLVSGDSFELIPEPIIDIDQTRSTAFLTASIMHFSEVAIGFADYFEVSPVTLSPPGNQQAGVPFTAAVDVQRAISPPTFVLQSSNDTIKIAANWTLENTFKEVKPASLSPYFVKLPTTVQDGNTTNYALEATMNCAAAGATQTQIEYEGVINWNYTFNGQNARTKSYIRSQSPTFNCSALDQQAAQYEQWRQFALQDVNRLRAENGVGPLTINPLLNVLADIHAEDMAVNSQILTHEGSLGEQSFDRIKTGKIINLDTGSYQTLPVPGGIDQSGENIGQRNINFFAGNAEDAIQDQHEWYMSTGSAGVTQRTLMLSESAPFTEIGIGLFLDDVGNLWIVHNYISKL